MKGRMRHLARGLWESVRNHPAEVALSVLFFLCGAWLYSWDLGIEGRQFEGILSYSPVLFLTACLLRWQMDSIWKKALYYLSPLLAIPFFFLKSGDGMVYPVSLLLIQCAYLWATSPADNGRFMASVGQYIRAAGIAFLLGTAVFLASWLVLISLCFIFYQENPTAMVHFFTCSLSGGYALAAPLLFLHFNQADKRDEKVGKALVFLLNFVLTPALLAYTGILYLYMVKIAVTTTLPQGKVAVMTVGFAATLFLLKGFQPLLPKRHYDWFFRKASWVALPALALGWTGAIYRIEEYGFTAPRVYLVAALAVLTATALRFLAAGGNYRRAVGAGTVLFALLSYVPGISADDIERYSQEKREAPTAFLPDGTERSYLSIELSDIGFPVDTPYTLYDIEYGGKDYPVQRFSYYYDEDSLYFKQGRKTVYAESYASLLEKQKRSAGVASVRSLPCSKRKDFLTIDCDSMLILLRSVTLHTEGGHETIDYIEPLIILKQ